MKPYWKDYPVNEVVEDLRRNLQQNRVTSLQAPPGSGKSTILPLLFLELFQNKIWLIQPRRLAARMVCERLASLLEEAPGQTVGYRTRDATKVSRQTRLEVVTTGVFLNMVTADPELKGSDLVIYDEFHERGLENDLSLGILLDAREVLNPDLRLLFLSATMEGTNLQKILPDIDEVQCPGTLYPVEIEYRDPDKNNIIVKTVNEALAATAGNVLVFQPSTGEVMRTVRRLEVSLGDNCRVIALYAGLNPRQQREAIEPSADRKVIVATSIAETSLTIPGLSAVIDTGYSRIKKHDLKTGLSFLKNISSSTAEITQRTGRAGRLQAGRCYRIFHKADEAFRRKQRMAAVDYHDLEHFILVQALWPGIRLIDDVPASVAEYHQSNLKRYSLLDEDNRPTELGRQVARFSVSPHIACFLLACRDTPWLAKAAGLAAVIEEGSRQARGDYKDLTPEDLGREVARSAARLQKLTRQTELPVKLRADKDFTGSVVHYLAQHVACGHEGRYRMLSGNEVTFFEHRPTADRVLLLTTDGSVVQLYLSLDDFDESMIPDSQITRQSRVTWDGDRLVKVEQRMWQQISLDSRKSGSDDIEANYELLMARLSSLDKPPFEDDFLQLCARLECYIQQLNSEQVNHSEPALSIRSPLLPVKKENWQWLKHWLSGISDYRSFTALDFTAALQNQLGYEFMAALNRSVPAEWQLPSGRSIQLDYLQGEAVARGKLQEFFGLQNHPQIYHKPVVLELLSPGGKLLHRTSDIVSYWQNGYKETAREMRGRYPRHPWPDNPQNAEATRLSKKQFARLKDQQQ